MAEHAHGSDHHASGAVDETPISNSAIVVWGLVMILVFFGAAAVLSSIFGRITDEEVNAKVLSVGSPELLQQRAQESQLLSTYGYNDQTKGLVHIPIEEGMKRVIAEAAAPAPAVPAAPAPGQPAAPAPAPAGQPVAPAGEAAPPTGATGAPAAAKGDAAK